MTVPQHAEVGEWVVEHLLLVDQVGDMQTLSADDLAIQGFPTGFLSR